MAQLKEARSFSSARTLFGKNRPIKEQKSRTFRDKTLARGNFQMKELQKYHVSKQVKRQVHHAK
jgi:hypothetical protein